MSCDLFQVMTNIFACKMFGVNYKTDYACY